MIDQAIKDAISSNVRKDKLRHLVYNSGVISLLQDGMIKVLEGLTTIEELLKIIEFDDDEEIHSEGLHEAIETNEITKNTEENITEEIKEYNIENRDQKNYSNLNNNINSTNNYKEKNNSYNKENNNYSSNFDFMNMNEINKKSIDIDNSKENVSTTQNDQIEKSQTEKYSLFSSRKNIFK